MSGNCEGKAGGGSWIRKRDFWGCISTFLSKNLGWEMQRCSEYFMPKCPVQ